MSYREDLLAHRAAVAAALTPTDLRLKTMRAARDEGDAYAAGKGLVDRKWHGWHRAARELRNYGLLRIQGFKMIMTPEGEAWLAAKEREAGQ